MLTKQRKEAFKIKNKLYDLIKLQRTLTRESKLWKL